jgi:hypothetical protein
MSKSCGISGSMENEFNKLISNASGILGSIGGGGNVKSDGNGGSKLMSKPVGIGGSMSMSIWDDGVKELCRSEGEVCGICCCG